MTCPHATAFPSISNRPREDWGLFGPDSPAWRVWSSPTALMAFQRSIVVETFDPFLAAAVHDQNKVRYNAMSRFDGTIQYFLTVACGDARAAIEASEALMHVHARASGTEPISGKRYSANSPASQLWIHVTGWQSNLLCYERFGPGPLSAEDEKRYWEACVVAAELQTCKASDVPRSRDEVRQYYEAMRPQLCVSDRSRALIQYFLRSDRATAGTGLWLGSHAMAAATISTIPRWMREVGGFEQSVMVDRMVQPLARAAVRIGALPVFTRLALRMMAPSALPVMNQVLNREQPLHDEVLSVAEARRRYGRATATTTADTGESVTAA